MKLYRNRPLSYWLDTLRLKVFSHKWGSVTECIRAICYIINRSDLLDSYLSSDFGTADYTDSIWNVYFAGRRELEG